jgi:choline dehydrogenase-like flavoprotein
VGPNKFKSTYLKVVGGTTWHWLGTCLRFVPNDFRLRTAHGRGIDWPISYDELEPFYGEAEHEIGVAGDSGEPLGSPRSAGYPMPAIPQTFLDKAYARALTGTEYELRATPQARNSVSGNGRPACCGNASCIPICPIGAKYDATVHVAVAEKNGALLHAQTTATRIDVGAEGRVTAIRFKRWDGSEGVARGKVFVLAAHAIETPRLMLHSSSEALPNGVANRSGQVGRNLMDHPTQLSWALSREPAALPYCRSRPASWRGARRQNLRLSRMHLLAGHKENRRRPGRKQIEPRNQLRREGRQKGPMPSQQLDQNYGCHDIEDGIRWRQAPGDKKRQRTDLNRVNRDCHQPSQAKLRILDGFQILKHPHKNP